MSVIFSEEYNWYCNSIACMMANEIPKLIPKEHILSENEKIDYQKQWKKIVEEKKELRFLLNGTVISCPPIDYFDHQILERLKQTKEIEIYKFITDLMIYPIIPALQYSDYIYLYIKSVMKTIEKNR